MSAGVPYDADFYAWSLDQAEKVRAGQWSEIDAVNLAEEIEGMGRRERRELTSRLAVILTQLLKWSNQPGRCGTGWVLTSREQRRQAVRLLRENPSLRPQLDEAITDAYGDALIAAQRETGLAEGTFPAACPWPPDSILSDEFLPA